MKKTLPLLVISALLSGCATVSYTHLADLPGETLAEHQTLARYEGFTDVPCRHMTADCPTACEHGGRYAQFSIVEYTGYRQLSEYGDPKQDSFMIRFELKDGKADPELAPPLQKVIAGLEKGQVVQLDWTHVYVHDAGGAHPERIIVRLAE